MAEIGAEQIGMAQIGMAQIAFAQIRTREKRRLQVDLLQLEAGNILEPEVCPLPQRTTLHVPTVLFYDLGELFGIHWITQFGRGVYGKEVVSSPPEKRSNTSIGVTSIANTPFVSRPLLVVKKEEGFTMLSAQTASLPTVPP